MVGEVNNKDKCPCNSGNEYQNCCKIKITTTGSKIYNEQHILNHFLSSSNEFNNYWRKVKELNKKPIFWGSMLPNTPTHIKTRELTLPQGEHLIVFNQIPPKNISPCWL